MTNEEKQRYSRHIILPEIGIEGQNMLKNAKVLVIGAGGLGCPVLQYLGAAGVGTLGIVDFDKVDLSNLQRQILYSTEDIGQFKAEVAAKRIIANNPLVQTKTYLTRINKENALDIIQAYDLVVDGSDNFATRYLVNDACVILNKPLVFGAIFKFEGQLSVFNYKGGPSYRCLFPDQPSADSIPTCSQIGVLGVLPGIVGIMQANEAIKVILGREDVLSGRFLNLDILANSFFEFQVQRVEDNFKITELGGYDENCLVKNILEISVDELEENYSDYFLLDIRSRQERELAILEGSLHIPKELLDENISLLPRDKKIVVYCHFGKQSESVVRQLIGNFGFREVYNLTGGIHEWTLEIDNSLTLY